MSQALYSFGSGALFVRPTSQGNQPTNPTPVELAALQDCDVEFSWQVKALRGRYIFPVDQAVSDGKVSIKAKYGLLSNAQISGMVAQSISVGRKRIQLAEAGTVPASTPYTVTVANSANFVQDWGVTYASSGLALTPVASSPTQGQYSVAAGVYTFAAADASAAVLINYEWNDASTGSTVPINNELQGFGAVMEAFLTVPYKSDAKSLRLFSVIPTKMTRPTKQGDYVIGDFEGDAYANAAGNIGEWYEG